MKKAIYILLIMSSMGFTLGSKSERKQQPEKNRIIDQSSLQSGYIEVSANASYSLTTGS